MSDDTGLGQQGGCFPTLGAGPRRVVRWRGWRKIAIGILAVILVLGVIDVAATVYEGAALRSKLAALKAAGVPISWKEVVPKPVPDAENAAKLYLQAVALIKQRDEANKKTTPAGAERVERYDSKDWKDPARMAVVARYVAEDADALAVVREATARPYCWFDLDWSSPPQTLFPHLARMRDLVRFVGSAAVVASMQGRQGEALDDLRMMFVMSRHVSPEPTLIDQLVCIAMDAIAARAVEMVIGRAPMPEDKARALDEELGRLDYMTSMDRAMEMERCFGIYMYDLLRRDPAKLAPVVEPGEPGHGSPGTGFWYGYGVLGRPLTYVDERYYLGYMDRAAKAMALPVRESGEAMKTMSIGRQAPWYAVLTSILEPVFVRVVVKRDQAIAERALVGAALGIEMYRQKTGRYPATLAEVRQTGWKVAEDSFSGGELKYRPVGATYLLYSIGQDLKDDGGKPMRFQLKALGRAAPEPEPGEEEKGDLVWLGTWEEAQKAEGR